MTLIEAYGLDAYEAACWTSGVVFTYCADGGKIVDEYGAVAGTKPGINLVLPIKEVVREPTVKMQSKRGFTYGDLFSILLLTANNQFIVNGFAKAQAIMKGHIESDGQSYDIVEVKYAARVGAYYAAVWLGLTQS